MLKSLVKLREGICFPVDPETGKRLSQREGIALADEIQHEIDRFYLPRPLFDDGEPAQFEDEFVDASGDIAKVQYFSYGKNFSGVRDCTGEGVSLLHADDRLKRPEKDTQEKIDADTKLAPSEYCEKFGLDYANYAGPHSEWPTVVIIRHLLERQRKLDGVER